jgi:hypothetical protein
MDATQLFKLRISSLISFLSDLLVFLFDSLEKLEFESLFFVIELYLFQLFIQVFLNNFEADFIGKMPVYRQILKFQKIRRQDFVDFMKPLHF